MLKSTRILNAVIQVPFDWQVSSAVVAAGFFLEMLREPCRGDLGCLLQCAGLFKQMGCAGHDLKPFFAMQCGIRYLIQFKHDLVRSADNQQGRRADLFQRMPARHIGPAAARYDHGDVGSAHGGKL